MIRIFLLLSIAVALLSLESNTTSFALYAAPAAVMAVAASIDPIFVSVAVAAEMLATSRSEIYQNSRAVSSTPSKMAVAPRSPTRA